MEFHEVADIFPMMTSEEYQQLVQSIKGSGLREPIWTYQGKIIDGRNRYKACLEAGIEPQYREWDGQGFLDQFVIDLNLSRRHLTPTQRAFSALKIEKLRGDEAKEQKIKAGQLYGKGHPKDQEVCENFHKPLDPINAAKQAASQVRANRHYVVDAKKITEQAPDIAEAAHNGIINMLEAKRLTKQPEPERKQILNMITSGQVKNVRKAQSILLKEERKQLAVQTIVEHEDYKVYHCPVADLHAHVEANSIDAIITDPPYPREFLGVYNDLANFTAHALKDGGSLVVMVSQTYLPDILDMLRKEPLRYHWLACYYMPGDSSKHWPRRIGILWKPLLWFVKGEYAGRHIRNDIVKYEDTFDIEHSFVGRKKEKTYHEWGQPVQDMKAIIEHFTMPGETVCDPFVGGGSTAVAAALCKRLFIGGDLDEGCIKRTREQIDSALLREASA